MLKMSVQENQLFSSMAGLSMIKCLSTNLPNYLSMDTDVLV